MRTLLGVLTLGRKRVPGFILVAVLVSAGTAASLAEPWIYRAIIDDIAGVFVAPEPLARAETLAESIGRSTEHLPGSGARVLHAPLKRIHPDAPRRALHPRTVPQAVATVLVGALLVLAIRAVSQALKMAGDNLSARLSNDLERDFILRTFRHVLRLPLGFFTSRASGAVAHQIDQSDQVAPVFAAFSQEIWPELFALVSVFAILFAVNREMAAVVLLVVPLYVLVTWRMSRQLDTTLERYYELWDEVSSRIQQAVAGIKTVQAHGSADHEERELARATGFAYETYLRRNRLQRRYAYVQDLLMTLSKAAVLAVGGLKALQHQLTPGDVVLFLAYVDRVYEPIEGLTALITSLQQNAGSVRRAQRLLDVPPTPGEELPSLHPGQGAVEFADVTFSYGRSTRRVLDGVSFRLRPGERVALIGPSGAGKTTLTDLLTALYRPAGGEIRLDEQPLSGVRPSSVRAAVRGVAADGVLFKGTIAANIRYGRFEATDEELQDAARLAGLDTVLARLPDGMEALIGERGVELSVGERQRVLLARAFLARPTVLILDEATSNLDFRTEEHIKDALQRLSQGRTTLLIAHRRSMLTDVDRVIVLRDGRIEQNGAPHELLSRDGYFRQMMTAEEGPGAS